MQSPAEKIQAFLSASVQSVATALKIILRSKYFVRLPKPQDESCIIMGNGPSMKEVVTNYQKQLQKHTLWAVNYFASSELFEVVKPSYYLIVGPEFWRVGVRQKNIELRKILFDKMTEKTTWPMVIFLPPEAFKSKFLKPYLNKNTNLHFKPFNTTPVEGLQPLCHFFFKRNLGMPRPHNVIIPSIMVALNMGLKKIYLIGVEHSWLPTISVNEQNEVLHRNQHFYDPSDLKDHKMYYLGLRPRRLHEVLHKLMLAFRGYFTILDYSKTQKAHIYNCTPGSFIDAFERKDIREVLFNQKHN